MSTNTMSVEQNTADTILVEAAKKGRSFLKWNGLFMILFGILAMIYPGYFTLSLTLLVGVLFLVGGVFSLIGSFAIPGTGPFFGSLLVSLLQMACGLIVLRQPQLGALVMTMMIAFVFMLDGAFQLSYAFHIRPVKGWGWMAFSAVVSVVAGFLLVAAMPNAAVWVIGLLFGVNFLTTGMASFSLSRLIPAE